MTYQKKNETEAEVKVDVSEDIKTETSEVKKKHKKKKFSPTDTVLEARVNLQRLEPCRELESILKRRIIK